MNNDLTLWAISAFGAFLLFRLLTRNARGSPVSEYETELNEILTNEKYKVKGRFE